MCGAVGDAISGLTHAVTGVVTGVVTSAVNLAKNIAVPHVPGVGQPPAPGSPPAAGPNMGTGAPSQAAQRPQNSAGSVAPGSAGSTLLTGGQGVAPSMLTLGKNTLLGQ